MDLTSICALFLLRYLKIVTDGDLELPIQFWGLRYLDTLVLEKPIKLYIPSDIVRLGRLLHLVVPRYLKILTDGDLELPSLAAPPRRPRNASRKRVAKKLKVTETTSQEVSCLE
jgi:disease resistance protein RPM1